MCFRKRVFNIECGKRLMSYKANNRNKIVLRRNSLLLNDIFFKYANFYFRMILLQAKRMNIHMACGGYPNEHSSCAYSVQ